MADKQHISQVLQQLYHEDIQDRTEMHWDNATKKKFAWLDRRDKKRRQSVLFLYQLGEVWSASDFHHAALIFQHGETAKDYATAQDFAKKAVELGDMSAKYLVAASTDRYLLSIGKPQRFGTQFIKNKSGEWKLVEPIDPDTTDEERAKYNVPPLSQALKQYKEANL